jgi:serine/threonine-protein kinase HipA
MKAKVSVDFNPDTFEIRSGFSSAKAGFIPCLIKFDGVLDGEMAGYYGKLEYVYNLVAADCGIEVPRSFLIESKSLDQSPAYHFVVERFDRDENKAKAVHVASYCGLGLSDFRRKNSSSYENLLRTIKGLCAADVREVEKGLRRCIFNLIMRNEDDHPKNFSFLMDQKGSWMLAPAYDLNYVKVSGGHQMSLNQKNENFLLKDILFLARSVDIKETKARHIIEEVTTSAKKFLNFADEVALDEDFATGVMGNFNWYL